MSGRGVAVAVLVVVCSGVTASGEESCYALDSNPYLNFGSKTAYEFVYNREGISRPPGCQALQVWLLSRHGTRFPSRKHFKSLRALNSLRDQALANHQANRSSLCAEDMDNLRRWSFNVSEDLAKELTAQGRQDLSGLGRRLAAGLPQLFQDTYLQDTYIFQHTDTARTRESAACFAQGVFGAGFNESLPPAVKGSDPLLNPYENCSAWRGLEESKRQDHRFKKSRWVRDVVANVSRRLGFQEELSVAQVVSMYDGCRYQKAWDVLGVSPWCAAFSRTDLEVLEYRGDLREFYKSGPGSAINLRLACPLLRDMLTSFRAVKACPDSAQPTARLYFSHDWMLQMLAARLNLTADPQPLTARALPPHRQFRTSRSVPFAANIAAVLYNCSGEALRVGLYQQETLIHLPGCDASLCDLRTLDQLYGSLTRDAACMDTAFCSQPHLSA